MDRRKFLQSTGLGTFAMVAGRSAMPVFAADTPASPILRVPNRNEVDPADTWDLTSLFPSDDAWDKAFDVWQKQREGYAAFQGKLAESAEKLAACLKFDLEVSEVGERLGATVTMTLDL